MTQHLNLSLKIYREKTVKKTFAFIIITILILISLPLAGNATAESLASRLKELGMFMGIGVRGDGTTEFDLDRAPSRAEAVVMLVRSIGKGTEAAQYPKTHPFTDVPQWADGYISYAYDNGLTSGISNTLFDSNAPVSAEMYLTFALRALGYSDGGGNVEKSGGDFDWDSPWALAAWCGILPPYINIDGFTRADVVNVTCAALYANQKDTQNALYKRLISENAFSGELFDAIFPADPFLDYRIINEKVRETIRADEHFQHEQIGAQYSYGTHMITDIAEDGGLLKVAALVALGNTRLYKNNTTKDLHFWTSLWLMDFNAKTYECVSIQKTWGLDEYNRPQNINIPKRAKAMWSLFEQGGVSACKAEVSYLIENGLMVYVQEYTYEELMGYYNSNSSIVIMEINETDICSVVSKLIVGMPGGAYGQLEIIYKDGAPLGEGETIYLPLPSLNNRDIKPVANDLRLSDDNMTLYYSFHFAEAAVIEGHTLHERGVYNYAVDLLTGKTELTINDDVDMDRIYVYPY